MKPEKFATTFGGSEFGPHSQEYRDGIRLGQFLSHKGYTVKCGGYYGLMEAVAAGVNKSGGKCIGITNASFDPKESNAYITKEQKASDLFERLRWLIEDSELFVIQKGSLGTLVEMFLVWCLKYTLTMPDIKICLIGECWEAPIKHLADLAVKPEFFSYLKIYHTLDDFMDGPH